MAGPVVLRAEPDVPILVPFLVIPPQRLQAGLGRRLVEPHRREHPARGIDARDRRAAALVRHHLDRVARGLESGLVAHVEHLVVRGAVVRQEDHRALGLVAVLTHPRQVRGHVLAHLLVVVQDADLTPDELATPHRERIRVAPGAADVHEQPALHVRIVRQLAHAPFPPGRRQVLDEVGALDRRGVGALPDVLVAVRVVILPALAQALQDGREAWVVPPVQLHHLDPRVFGLAKPLVSRAALARRVPGHPQFAVLLAQRRDHDVPRLVGNRLGLVRPQQQNLSLRLQRHDRALVQARELVGDPPAGGADVFLANLEVLAQPGLGLDRRLHLGKR